MSKPVRKLDSIRFGVEIEALFKSPEESKTLIEKKRIIPGWTVVYDGSLENRKGDVVGAEYRAKNKNHLYFNQDSIDQIKEVLSIMKVHKATVSPKCGLHVHVDMKDFTNEEIVSIVKTFITHQKEYYEQFRVFKCRLANHAHPIDKKVKDLINADIVRKIRKHENIMSTDCHDYFTDKYRALNIDALSDHGSLEFRLFNGSIQINSIKRAIRFALEFCIKNAKG